MKFVIRYIFFFIWSGGTILIKIKKMFCVTKKLYFQKHLNKAFFLLIWCYDTIIMRKWAECEATNIWYFSMKLSHFLIFCDRHVKLYVQKIKICFKFKTYIFSFMWYYRVNVWYYFKWNCEHVKINILRFRREIRK